MEPKQPYEPPALTAYEYVVEQGYANTTMQKAVYNREEISEYTDENGEYMHGEWY